MELLPGTIGDDTAAQAKELAAAKADVVIGPTDSSRAPAAIDVLSAAKVALISPANAASGAEHLQERRLLFPDLRGRHRPGLRPRQARQGRRRQDPRRRVRGQAAMARTSPPPSPPRPRPPARGPSPSRSSTRARLRKRPPPPKRRPGRRHPRRPGRRPGRHRGAEQRRAAGKKAHPQRRRRQRSTAPASGRGPSTGARGILPGVFPSAHFQGELVSVDPGLKDMTFAAETYDAVNLAAVAAAAADDDAGTSIAARLIAVSGGDAPGRRRRPPAGEPRYARPTRSA